MFPAAAKSPNWRGPPNPPTTFYIFFPSSRVEQFLSRVTFLLPDLSPSPSPNPSCLPPTRRRPCRVDHHAAGTTPGARSGTHVAGSLAVAGRRRCRRPPAARRQTAAATSRRGTPAAMRSLQDSRRRRFVTNEHRLVESMHFDYYEVVLFSCL